MTKIVCDRILKDVNGGNISDHLRNHIHLTNCIHLKNHMHKRSPILADRSLMRDLAILQRSRSLRDPSASPPSWHSPSAVDALFKGPEIDSVISNGRRSVGIDRPLRGRRLSGSSPLEVHVASSKLASGEHNRHVTDGVATASSECSSKSGSLERRRVRREYQDDHFKTLSEQLHGHPIDSDEVASSSGYGQHEKQAMGAKANIRTYCNGRVKRRGRRTRSSISSRDAVAHGVSKQICHTAEEEADTKMTRAPRNGCGIPWNWSRIHDRSKTFLDMAGRSFSCGLSDSRLKKGGGVSQEKDTAAIPVTSEYTSSSCKSTDAFPLLFDASGSLGSKDNTAWVHDYSGELGIFADNLLKHEIDSELRSGRERHQSLTQKYKPRSFRDLVGQHLVAQALFNAVAKRKVGLLYVFYGPHGTGKTSCARIFARALNCQSMEHSKPCGICNSCTAYDMGKSRNIKEIGPVSNFNYQNLLDNMSSAHLPSQYRVFIFDDCETLSPDSWAAIIKVIDRSPRRFVIVLVCSTLDVLPHMIISRCQKFFFPKLKDADIIYTLQWLATKEGLEIDKDALKLIATRSDGSLRDAEMTLEQLSLLGLRISVPLVQELVGLISDDKLVDLLDLALSADTVNTVKILREIMESGVEPLALMSQLATVITDILAGSYDFTKDSHLRKFFRDQTLSKEDMERLRQALKTLSEAEKQLRTSNDRLTWLTAALLQLAPDRQYILPSSSAGTSLNESPLGLNYAGVRERLPRERGLSTEIREERHQDGSCNAPIMRAMVDRDGNGVVPQQTHNRRLSIGQASGKLHNETEEIWAAVLNKIHINSLKQFLYQEGKLISVSSGTAPTVQLMFSSHKTKSKADKFRVHILQAFESVIGLPVTIEIRVDLSRDDSRAGPIILPASQDDLSHMDTGNGHLGNQLPLTVYDAEGLALTTFNSTGVENSEIVGDYVEGTRSVARVSNVRKPGDGNQSPIVVRSKEDSLTDMIQLEEGCSRESRWSKCKAGSIAEKLEEENLRLEPRSRSLLCWNSTTVSRRKFSCWKSRSRKPKSLLKLVSCGKCGLSGRSPRQQ